MTDVELLKRLRDLYDGLRQTIRTDRELNEKVPPLRKPHKRRHPLAREELGTEPSPELMHEISLFLAMYVWSCEQQGIHLRPRLASNPRDPRNSAVGLKFFKDHISIRLEGSLPSPRLVLPIVKTGLSKEGAVQLSKMMHPATTNLLVELSGIWPIVDAALGDKLGVAPRKREKLRRELKRWIRHVQAEARRADVRLRTAKLMTDLDDLLQREPAFLRGADRHRIVGRLLEIAGAQKPGRGDQAHRMELKLAASRGRLAKSES